MFILSQTILMTGMLYCTYALLTVFLYRVIRYTRILLFFFNFAIYFLLWFTVCTIPIIRLFYRARLSSRSSACCPFSFSASIEIRFCVVLLSNFVFPAFALNVSGARLWSGFSVDSDRLFAQNAFFAQNSISLSSRAV